MKLGLFGITGGTGAHVARLALERGHEVTAVAREPAAVKWAHPSLRVVRGDALDAGSLVGVLAGRDVVISTIGPRHRAPVTTIYSEGVLNIARATAADGARRLIAVVGLGVDPAPDLPLPVAIAMRVMVRPLFGFAYRDAAEMERQLAGVDVDWTSVRAPMLNDRERGSYRSATASSLRHPVRIGRADLARYLLDIAGDRATYRTWTEVAW